MGKKYLLIAALIICTASGAFAGNLKALSNAVTVRSAGPQFLKHRPPFLKPGMIVKADFQSDIDKESENYFKFDADMENEPDVRIRAKARTKKPVALKTRTIKREPRRRAPSTKRESIAQVGEDDNGDALNMDIENDLVQTPLKPGGDDESKDIIVSPPSPLADDEVGVTRQGPKKSHRNKAAKSRIKKRHKRAPREQRTVTKPTVRHRTLSRTIRKVRPLSSRPWSTPAGAFSVRAVPRGEYSAHVDESQHYRPVPPPKTHVRNGVMVRLAQPQGPPPQQHSSGLAETGTDVLNAALDLVGMPFAFVSSLF